MNPIQIQKRKIATRRTKSVFVDNFFHSQANQKLSAQVVPHLGLMSLASVLEADGHGVEIFDPKILYSRGDWKEPGEGFLNAWAKKLLERGADIVGFTAYGRSLPYVIRVAQKIRQSNPEQKIVLGGPHATIVGERILSAFDCFDVVVRYEAEPLITELVGKLSQGADLNGIDNLVYRQGKEIIETSRRTYLTDMDSLPAAGLHLYPIDQLQLAELSIEAGRGCPFDCTFCSTSRFFQRRYRLKSNQKMLAEMEEARSRYGINVFNLNHDLFGLVKKSVHEFCEMARGRDFNWKCSMRSDTIDSQLIEALASAGCRHIYFGLETGSAKLQKTIRKNLNLTRTYKTLEGVINSGIYCTASFITGFPEETEVEQDETLDMIGNLLRLDAQRIQPQLHVLSPEPGSALAANKQPLSYDGIGPEVDELVDNELIENYPDIFSVFYHYPSATPRWRVIMASAFVSHLIPEMGYPLTAHIVSNFFSGSLAELFRETVCDATTDKLPYQRLVNLLRQGLDTAIKKLGPEASYLQELVRLGRVLSAIKQYTPSKTNDETYAPDGGTWLAKFDYDVLNLATQIISNSERRLPSSTICCGEHWVIIDHRVPEILKTGSLGIEPGRWMSLANSSNRVLPEQYSQQFRELGVDRIQC